MKVYRYEPEDTTYALTQIRQRIDVNGETIPRGMADRARRILHRLPPRGELTWPVDAEHWTATDHVTCLVIEGVRRRVPQTPTPKLPAGGRGPARLERMFRL